MRIARPVLWLFVVALVLAASLAFFLIRMYRGDVRALEAFMASYERFDRAAGDLALSPSDEADRRAGQASAELRDRSDLRLSSLIRNDGLLMTQAVTIADLAGREFDELRAYRRSAAGAQRERGGSALPRSPLGVQRKAAWARFKELARTGD